MEYSVSTEQRNRVEWQSQSGYNNLYKLYQWTLTGNQFIQSEN